jgi:hypothetical protein
MDDKLRSIASLWRRVVFAAILPGGTLVALWSLTTLLFAEADTVRNDTFLKEKGYFTDLIGDDAVRIILTELYSGPDRQKHISFSCV